MSRQIREALANLDWDAEAQAADAHVEALRFFAKLLELRGAVPFDEAYDAYLALKADLEKLIFIFDTVYVKMVQRKS